ncbi:MAG: glycosyltransferase family 39 protein [Candidatus Aenigmatarchaeota archaeon]
MQETYILFTKRINPYLFLFLLSIFLYVPSSFLREPFYPDEARNIFITNNIKNLKDYFFPKYLEGIYFEKPPFYFWLLKIFFKIKIFNYLVLPVLFNSIVSWAIASLNYSFLKKENAQHIGFLSSIFLITSGLFYGMNILVRMDILFLFFIILIIFLFFEYLEKRKIILFFLSSFFSFLAVFTKGAFGIIFPFFIEFIFGFILKDKKVFLKVILNNLLSLLLISFWLFSFSKIEPHYFQNLFFYKTLMRAVGAQSHKAPIYYYLIYILWVFLPWSFFILGYILNFKKTKLYLWEKIYLIWFLGGFIILSLIESKLVIYLLLISVPFFSFLAKFICEAQYRLKKNLLFFIFGFFVISWIIAFFYFKYKKEHTPLSSYGVIILLLITFFFIIKRPFPLMFRNFFVSWLILIQMINFLFLPLVSENMDFKKISKILLNINRDFDKIYIKEKSLFLLSVYSSFNKPLIYLEEKETPTPPFLLITKEELTLEKISKIGDFYIFYKNK